MFCEKITGPRVRRLAVIAAWMAGASTAAADDAATDGHFPTRIGEYGFRLADGWRLDRVAGENLIRWPIVANFDRDGDLLVLESGGVSTPIAEDNRRLAHRLVRLIDEDGDGSFDRRVVAADRLPFPAGVLPLGHEVFVAAPPSILRLVDDDGDGVFERRSVWFDGGTVTYCANDLHGPYLGCEGWLYWCKGAFAEQTHPLIGGGTMTTRAAHIFRRPVDSNDPAVDVFITGGMDNPVDVAFTDDGEAFFTATWMHHPGGDTRDGLGHAVCGATFGKSHDVLDPHDRTGDLMPVMTHLGPAAPSGLAAIGRDRLVAALFNTARVTAFDLHPNGATHQTVSTDLLVGDRLDFHPTDVLDDGRGGILVVDTGGWYDLCCPTSRVDQKTAAGGIYRLSRIDAPTGSAPPVQWQDADVEQLWGLRCDDRPYVRAEAWRRIRQTPQPFLDRIIAGVAAGDAAAVRAAGWVAGSAGDVSTSAAAGRTAAALVAFVDDPASDATTTAGRSARHLVATLRLKRSTEALARESAAADAVTRRIAATTLARRPVPSTPPIIRSGMAADDDRYLTHARRNALIQWMRQFPDGEISTAGADPAFVADVLWARGQTMPDTSNVVPGFDVETLIDLWGDRRSPAASAADRVLKEHPGLAGPVIRWLSDNESALEAGGRKRWIELLVAWRDTPEASRFVLERLRQPDGGWEAILDNIERLVPRPVPPPWRDKLVKDIGRWSDDQAVAIASLLIDSASPDPPPPFPVTSARSPTARLCFETVRDAWGSTERRSDASEDEPVRWVMHPETNDGAIRLALQHRRWSDAELLAMAAAIGEVPSARLQGVLSTIIRRATDDVVRATLNRLPDLSAAATLPAGFLEATTRRHRPDDESLVTFSQKVDAELVAPPADIRAAVERRLSELPAGDATRGLTVFHSEAARCGTCHRVGYVGGEIGPDLTRIGGSRTAVALLEAIMYPSRRLEQGYRSVAVLTDDGRVANGIRRDGDAATIRLHLSDGTTTTIPRDAVESVRESDVSVMPKGLDRQVTDQQLADLLAMLRAAR